MRLTEATSRILGLCKMGGGSKTGKTLQSINAISIQRKIPEYKTLLLKSQITLKMKRKKQNRILLEEASEVLEELQIVNHPEKLKNVHIILENKDESALQLTLTMRNGKVLKTYDTHESPYEMSDRNQSTSGLIN